MVSNCLLVFEECSLPHPCLQAKLHPYSYPILVLSSSPHSWTPYCAQSTLTLFLLLSVSPVLHPLRAAGLGRSLLQRSELITCLLDRRATWGHTLPEDSSIHAGGTETGGLRPEASSRVRAETLNCKRSRGTWLDAGTAAAWAWRPGQVEEAAKRGKGQRCGARVSDRGLHGPAEALLIHGWMGLTGERTAPSLMVAAKVGAEGNTGAGWCKLLHCEVSLMGW